MKLKNVKKNRLNNKGFTLIELLAVVVILAVVMGIAMTSVLSAMNNSRKGSLQDSAKSVAQAFQTKYSEALVTATANDVYGGNDPLASGYNFTASGAFKLSEKLNNELNLSTATYELAGDIGAVSGGTTPVDTSFIAFDGKSFMACLVAVKSGSYYVSTAVGKNVSVEFGDVTYKFSNDTMWACSLDNSASWLS